MTARFPSRVPAGSTLAEHQLAGLRWTVRHVHGNSPFYRARLEAAGVASEDIRSRGDLARLPFTTADDLAAEYPFPLRSVAEGRIVRIHSSSGTTGKRKILCYTQKDVDDWAEMFARCYETAGLTREDRVQICVGYGLWTAGVGFQLGCERFGAMAIPVGPGNLEMQCSLLADLGTTVLCCTASMALLMAEEIHRRGIAGKTRLRRIILGAERSSEAMLSRIRELTGVETVHDITGLTELYGPGTGISCAASPAIHYWADWYILELLHPETLAPVPPGEVGEMVYTTLSKEAAPLVRYRSRDLTRLVPGPCPCGCPFPRHDRILGRSDDVVIFRGVNIYPGQIDEVLSRVPGLGSEYQVVLDRGKDGKDHLTIRVERAAGAEEWADERAGRQVAQGVKHVLMVSCNPEIVPHASLPRSERKTKRIFDNRA